MTDDVKRYERAKREMKFFTMLHGSKNICNLIAGKAVDAANDVAARCACVFNLYEFGTVQNILEKGDDLYTCLLYTSPSPRDS